MMHAVTLCGRGLHEMTEDNTLITHDGSKRCRRCRRIAARKRRAMEQQPDSVAIYRVEEVDDNTVDFELPRGSLPRKWEVDAKCKGMGNSKWFFAPLLEDEMVAYCQDCPVLTLCWAYAVAAKEAGVWGGTTESQRQKLTLEQRIQVRRQYHKLYADYLGLGEPEELEHQAPAAPNLGDREATIQRAIDASDAAESMAGVTIRNRMFGSL